MIDRTQEVLTSNEMIAHDGYAYLRMCEIKRTYDSTLEDLEQRIDEHERLGEDLAGQLRVVQIRVASIALALEKLKP